jgi:uncharacterized protein Smg (DUF494 family)
MDNYMSLSTCILILKEKVDSVDMKMRDLEKELDGITLRYLEQKQVLQTEFRELHAVWVV